MFKLPYQKRQYILLNSYLKYYFNIKQYKKLLIRYFRFFFHTKSFKCDIYLTLKMISILLATFRGTHSYKVDGEEEAAIE